MSTGTNTMMELIGSSFDVEKLNKQTCFCYFPGILLYHSSLNYSVDELIKELSRQPHRFALLLKYLVHFSHLIII